MVLAPGSFFTIATISDKIIILPFTWRRSWFEKGGGIVSYTSRGQLKECKIMSRADFQIIIALPPRKKNMHKTNFIRDEHRTLVSPTGVDNVLQKSVPDKSTAFGLQFLYG